MKKLSIALFSIFMLFSCLSLGIYSLVPERTLQESFTQILESLQFAVQVILFGLSLASIAGILFTAWVVYERGLIWHSAMRLKRAEAEKAERDVRLILTVTPPGHQIVETSIGRVNGQLTVNHTPVHLLGDAQRWAYYNGRGQGSEPVLALPDNQTPLPDTVELGHYLGAGSSLRSIFLGIGRLPDGRVQPVSAPMDQLIHIAIGGAPGFGKSTFMQTLAYQVLNSREGIKPVFLDPQAVTFSPFAGDDRLLYPVASEPEMIMLILSELVKEMQRRQALFGQWRGVMNLAQYNQAVGVENRLQPIPIFFDEFGLIGDNKDIAKLGEQLSRGGRKSGLQLIVGTQHWGYKAVSTAFRGDLSTRVQFYSVDKTDSRILLGDGSASSITRKGQAFVRLPGIAGMVELQAADPGQFVNVTPEFIPQSAREMVIDRLNGSEDEERRNEDEYFVSLVESGKSRRQASLEAYGKPYAGDTVMRGRKALGEVLSAS